MKTRRYNRKLLIEKGLQYPERELLTEKNESGFNSMKKLIIQLRTQIEDIFGTK